MADSGVNYKQIYGTTSVPASPTMSSLLGAEWNGKVRTTYDSYTFTSGAIGLQVNMGILLAGEVFLGGWLNSGALGSGVRLQVGDSVSGDRYMVATTCTVAGQITLLTHDIGLGYKATVDTPILVKTSGAIATGDIKLVIIKAASN